MIRDKIVAAARSMVGTRVHQGGRLPGVGLDCGGLIVCVPKLVTELQPVSDVPLGYSYRTMSGLRLYRVLRERFDETSLEQRRPGTIMGWWVRHRLPGRKPLLQHLGIWTGSGCIMAADGTIVELSDAAYWREREYAAFEFRLRGAEPQHSVVERCAECQPDHRCSC